MFLIIIIILCLRWSHSPQIPVDQGKIIINKQVTVLII